MHDAVQHGAVALPVFPIAENSSAQHGAVERAAFAVDAVFGEVIGCGQEQVWGCGGEVREDAVVAGGAGFDDFAGEDVGVDDGEGVRGFAEDLRDGGFAGGDGAGEAEEEHGCWWWGEKCLVER